ncbi:MAG UNVERIFIED_CONTAM: hypothetical protein LOD86_10940 [Thermobifida fusca]
MPRTPIYGLEYERVRGETPGRTLHGADGSPILAEQVEAELQRIDDDIAELVGVTIPDLRLAASRVTVLDVINTGGGTNTTEFVNIPQTYRDLIIVWQGASNGSGQLDSLALRFNGDAGNNYHSRLTRNLAAGGFMDTDGAGSNYTFSVLRAGYVGTLRSAGQIVIPNYAGSGQKFVSGTNVAVGQSGGDNVFCISAGGRWTGTDPIHSVRIWPSGQLWEGNPSLTLIGVR